MLNKMIVVLFACKVNAFSRHFQTISGKSLWRTKIKSSPFKIEGVPEGRGRMNRPSVTNKAGTAPRSSCPISFRQSGRVII